MKQEDRSHLSHKSSRKMQKNKSTKKRQKI